MEGERIRGKGLVGVVGLCVLLIATHVRTEVSSPSFDFNSKHPRLFHRPRRHSAEDPESHRYRRKEGEGTGNDGKNMHGLMAGPRNLPAEDPASYRYRRAMEEGTTKNGKKMYGLTAGPGYHYAGDSAIYRHRRKAGPMATDKTKHGFSAKEVSEIVNRHNMIRRQLGSSSMRYMIWNSELESLAQDWSDKCNDISRPLQERINKSKHFEFIGESFFAASTYTGVNDLLETFEDEKEDYNTSNNECTHYCERYKQMIWANTSAVGCGITFCRNLSMFDAGGYRAVCNYGPTNLTPGLLPFKKGKPCSACAPDFPLCKDRLCARKSHAAVNVVSLLSLGYCLLWFLICSV